VLEHDDEVIYEAIRRELRRGGQVFYLHNFVDSIYSKAAKLREAFPDHTIAVGHGKMDKEELSDVWADMVDGKIDILVCTTIIESGVNVPNANTLIVESADRMGLAQLHQIRGRVGRSSRRAYAYFTYNKNRELTEIAQRRLSAIREFTEFGSGFRIAMRDLEIRGAGNILGAKQHGHLEAVGYDMYLQMLSEAVTEEQTNEIKEPQRECLVDIRIDAHIPERYIDSVPQRLAMYRKIASVRSEESAEDVIDELIDRYGDVPESVNGLITVSLIRNSAMKHKIYEIRQNNDNLLLYSDEIDADKVAILAKAMRGRILVSAASKPYISVKVAKNEKSLDTLRLVMKLLDKQ
jgi:transcription-repair coupling factor (superfamily II helicase)